MREKYRYMNNNHKLLPVSKEPEKNPLINEEGLSAKDYHRKLHEKNMGLAHFTRYRQVLFINGEGQHPKKRKRLKKNLSHNYHNDHIIFIQ